MKQKIVIKVPMDCEKCRNKALKTAAEVKGVTSVSLEGDDKDSLAVIGDNVDTVCLANSLNKKFRSVTIVSVEKVKSAAEKKADEDKKKAEEKKKQEEELEKCQELLCKGSSNCHGSCCYGKCGGNSPKCPGSCNPTCTKCESTKCFTICIKCESSKCSGECKPKPSCSNCSEKKCQCKPKDPSPCYQTCPPFCTCVNCYIPYPSPVYNPYPHNYTVVYDQPDTCSIM